MSALFIDIDTQLDFLYPAGALYVPGAERLIPTLGRLTQFAAQHGITVVSTVDAHTEDDPEFATYPHHCVAGTAGQRKPAITLRDGQVIIEKQKLDCFSSPHLQPLLAQLNADRYVVYGVVTEICVRYAAFGLLKTGQPVQLVTDAVKALDEQAASKMFQEFTAAGGRLTVSADILAGL